MTLPGMGPKRDAVAVARIRAWVLDEVGGHDGAVVVTELACKEPGCPPVETVLGLLGPGEQTRHTIHKRLGEITRADVTEALRDASH